MKATASESFWNVGKILTSETHVYIFVWFEDDEKQPRDHFFIVPSGTVERLKKTHRNPRVKPWISRKDILGYEDEWSELFRRCAQG